MHPSGLRDLTCVFRTRTMMDTEAPAIPAIPAIPAVPAIPASRRSDKVRDDGRKMLSVASGSPVKQVAGSIAHTARDNDFPPLLSAVGPASVNQAVKAIAIARTYLESDLIDLMVRVERCSSEEIKDLFVFNLIKIPSQKHNELPIDEENVTNLKSARASGTNLLAGALSKNIRDDKVVKITSVGQTPVFRAVDSIITARKFLEEDNIDIEFQPEFTHVSFSNGQSANAIQMVVTKIADM